MQFWKVFIEVLKALKCFTKTGAGCWAVLLMPLIVVYYYIMPFYISKPHEVWYLVFAHRAVIAVYFFLNPFAIYKLAKQTQHLACPPYLRAPRKMIWATTLFYLGMAISSGMVIGNVPKNILIDVLTTTTYLVLGIYTLIGASCMGIICSSFEAKCRYDIKSYDL